jgi:hypothetical protein
MLIRSEKFVARSSPNFFYTGDFIRVQKSLHKSTIFVQYNSLNLHKRTLYVQNLPCFL